MTKAPQKHPLVRLLTSTKDKENIPSPSFSLAVCKRPFLGFLCVLLATNDL